MFFSQQRKKEKRGETERKRRLFNEWQQLTREENVQVGFVNVPESHFKEKDKKDVTKQALVAVWGLKPWSHTNSYQLTEQMINLQQRQACWNCFFSANVSHMNCVLMK